MDEQWQKQRINLNSVIDSNMTDMLRSISDPAFIFNRQVLQGGYLPTSLRYEKNGWFCGKYGYDFDLNSPEALHDTKGYMGDMKVERRLTYVSTAYQITDNESTGSIDFVYYPLTRVLAYASDKEPQTEWVADENGDYNIIKVTGKTHDFNNSYTMYINAKEVITNTGVPSAKSGIGYAWETVDDEAIDFDGDGNPDQENTFSFDQRRYVFEYTVYDKDNTFSDEFTLKYGLPFFIGDEKHEVSFEDNEVTYGDDALITLRYNGDYPYAVTSVSAESEDINITTCSLQYNSSSSNAQPCAAVLGGSIDISTTDNITAVTEKYYTGVSLLDCVCTQTAIGRNSTATIFCDGNSKQVSIVGAAYSLGISASCAFYFEPQTYNTFNDPVYYKAGLQLCVPVTVARNFFLVRFFGDDIYYAGQDAKAAGIVLTAIPAQDFCLYDSTPVCYGAAKVYPYEDEPFNASVAYWCNERGYKNVYYCAECYNCGCPLYIFMSLPRTTDIYACPEYCSIFGNKIYKDCFPACGKDPRWLCDECSGCYSPCDTFTSSGKFFEHSVNADPSYAGYNEKVSLPMQLYYSASNQSVKVNVCIQQDSLNSLATVLKPGCVLCVTASEGFTAGRATQSSLFTFGAPIPGNIPRFITHDSIHHCTHIGPNSRCVLDTFASNDTVFVYDNGWAQKSFLDALMACNPTLGTYWQQNLFHMNVEVTPVTMIYETYLDSAITSKTVMLCSNYSCSTDSLDSGVTKEAFNTCVSYIDIPFIQPSYPEVCFSNILTNRCNSFGIYLDCLCVSTLTLCCTEIPEKHSICKDVYGLELTPYLTGGYVYIPSDINTVPAWATSSALQGCEPNWSISSETSRATQLGDDCGLSTQIYVPVEYCYANRLIDATVTTTHDSYHNLKVLSGLETSCAQTYFVDKYGCVHCNGNEWTRDNAITCAGICKECIHIMHNASFGCCASDYMLCFNPATAHIENTVYSSTGAVFNSIALCNDASVGNYNASSDTVPGYTTKSACTTFNIVPDINCTATEPYALVHFHGNYPFCTHLPLSNVIECDKAAFVTKHSKGVYTLCFNDADTMIFDSCQEGLTSRLYKADVSSATAEQGTCAGCMCACVSGADFDYATFTIEGIYKNTGTEDVSMRADILDSDYITLHYANCADTTQISKEDIINNKTFLDVTATDIDASVHAQEGTDNTNETKIASIELNSEYQLVKQQWDSTVATENIWWIDSEHILELTRDFFIIKEKKADTVTGKPMLDDWDGDQWEVVKKISRSSILDTTVVKSGMSSVYGDYAADNGGALFYTVNVLNSKTFRLNIYEVQSTGFRKVHTQKFVVKEQNYSTVLSQELNELAMYVFMDTSAIFSQGEITATHAGKHFIIGIHVDSALRQWSFVFSKIGNNFQLVRKITGYGYVGTNGTLTGGQFPNICVNAEYGFFGTVNFIDDLVNYHNKSVEGDFNMIGIYGNQEQQWYIYKSIDKICSHIQFVEAADVKGSGGSSVSYVCKWLPLKSTYSAKYSSPSFLLNRLTGFMPEPTTLGSIFDFGNSSVNSLISTLTSIASPSIWFLNTSWTKLGFLNQAIGQYAYTYRSTNKDVYLDSTNIDAVNNENEKKSTDSQMKAFAQNGAVLTHDALSFDKQEFEQTCTTKSTSNGGVQNFWLCLLQAGISGINNAAVAERPKADTVFNKTAIGETAKAFSQFAVENALNAAYADLGIQKSTDITLASKVTAVKTLDMFYSTSSKSMMYAGPGYVCHNFIGYCVAQSMSNRFLSGSQSTMFTALAILSNLSFMFKVTILKAVDYLLGKLAESMKGSGTYVMGSGTTWGDIVAAIMYSGQFASQQLIKTNEFFIDTMPQILQSICPNFPNAQFATPGSMSSHEINIEAKHNYGSKHVTFMYPCFGCESTYFTKETVEAVIKDVPVKVDFTPQTNKLVKGSGEVSLYTSAIENVTDNSNAQFQATLYDDVHSHLIYAKGSSSIDNVPPDTAVVEGTTTFLPTVPFKNENIDVSMVFPTMPVQDYMIDDSWNIGFTANEGGILWTSVKDTKLLDGAWSNLVVTDTTALIASPYTAIELKKQIEKEYIRPVAITPNALAWNMTGLNVSYDGKMYHGFDGTGYKLVHWAGTSGMGTEDLTLHYCFQENDHFKRSNILMPNHYFGSFTSLPVVYADTDARDNLYHQYEIDTKGIGIENLTSAENKNLSRYAIPVFTEQLSTMPSVIKTLSSYRLNVIQGVTSLTSDIRITQNKYKIPKSIDFNINKNLYRATDEYINALNESGLSVGDLTSKLGLEFIGATPTQAFFYSEATKSYYSFTGSAMIQKQDVWNRFKDIKDGKWDFVNQNVVFQCIGNMTRVMDDVNDRDDDLVDNIFIATMNGQQQGITGEITPPGTPVFNNKSWFKTYSFAGGLTFQGPNRYVVNRFICLDYMIDDIVANKGKWKKLKRDKFNPFRKYEEDFKTVDNRIGDDYIYTEASSFADDTVYYYNIGDSTNPVWKRAYGLDAETFAEGTYYTRKLVKSVEGWTHNPFVLATAPLGVSEETDCVFEWELTFTWTDEMDSIYKNNEYACVNIMAQTMCPGGKKRCEPTHLYLHKDLFTRSDNTGYYSFKFASRNGAGNREQLFVWSDAYIAMTGLSVNYKVITERRTMPLTTSQIDIREMKEF